MSNEQPVRPEVITALRSALETFSSMAQAMAAMTETLRGTLAALDKAVERADVPALISDCTCEHPNDLHNAAVGCLAEIGSHNRYFCQCTSPTGGEL